MVSCLAEERFYFKRCAGSGSSLDKCMSGLLFVLKCSRSTDVRTWSGCVWLILSALSSVSIRIQPHAQLIGRFWKPGQTRWRKGNLMVFRSMLLRHAKSCFPNFCSKLNKLAFTFLRAKASLPLPLLETKGTLWRACQHGVARQS